MNEVDWGTILGLFAYTAITTLVLIVVVALIARLFEPMGRRLRDWLWPDDEQEFEEKP